MCRHLPARCSASVTCHTLQSRQMLSACRRRHLVHCCSAVECRNKVEAVSCRLRLSRQLPPSTGSLALAGCLFAIA